MRVCDICESKNDIKERFIMLYFNLDKKLDEFPIELCDKCLEYFNNSSIWTAIRIGLKSMRDHE